MSTLSLLRPEYFLRPKQALKRLVQKVGLASNPKTVESLELPWHLAIGLIPGDEISRAIFHTGIYDLCLTEALWRLTKEGSFCVDVGANVGYATSIMAKRATKKGRVISFEPHPETFKKLSQNADSWSQKEGLAPITCYQTGISDSTGTRALHIPEEFIHNSGMAHFYDEDSPSPGCAADIPVQCTTLDQFIRDSGVEMIDLLKIDIEGHEIQAFKGASQLLQAKKIRCILFEDSRSSWRTPQDLYKDYLFLMDYGYSLFRLRRGIFGPVLEKLDDLKADNSSLWRGWEPPNFLAIADVSSDFAPLAQRGWLSLAGK